MGWLLALVWRMGFGLGLGIPVIDYGYYYPDAGDYYYSYAPTGYADSGAVVDSGVAALSRSRHNGYSADDRGGPAQGANEALQFYSEARMVFLAGRLSKRLAAGRPCGRRAPRNPKVHELISLALFAWAICARGRRGACRDGAGSDCRLERFVRLL